MTRLRIYTNESVPVAVAEGLQRREVDAWSARDSARLGTSDEEQWTYDDPPLYMVYSEPDIVPPPDAKPGQFIHHSNFGRQLKAKMDELGIENVFINSGGNPPTPQPLGGMLDFLKKHLVK